MLYFVLFFKFLLEKMFTYFLCQIWLSLDDFYIYSGKKVVFS